MFIEVMLRLAILIPLPVLGDHPLNQFSLCLII